jgi:hypothetical protein
MTALNSSTDWHLVKASQGCFNFVNVDGESISEHHDHHGMRDTSAMPVYSKKQVKVKMQKKIKRHTDTIDILETDENVQEREIPACVKQTSPHVRAYAQNTLKKLLYFSHQPINTLKQIVKKPKNNFSISRLSKENVKNPKDESNAPVRNNYGSRLLINSLFSFHSR